MSDASAASISRRAKLLALVALVVLAVFGPGLVGGFVWDDRTLIVSNAYLRDADLATLLRGDFWHTSARGEADGAMLHAYWRPVVTLAYALQYKLFGESPFGYHLVNGALHLGCSLLAWGFVRRRVAGDDLTRDAAATVGALVFAAHPSRPESVTWVSGSTDLWMALWVLLAARTLDGEKKHRGLVAGALLALGLFSKETAVVAPLLLFADAVLLERAPAHRRAVGVSSMVLAAALALRVFMAPPRTLAQGATALADTLARTASTLGHYARATVWPAPPSAQLGPRMWSAAGAPAYAPWSVALGVTAALALTSLAVAAWRAPRWRPALADALWFIGPLALLLNALDLRLDVLASMRFLYLPLLGVASLSARAVTLADAHGKRNASLALAGALVAAMMVSSSRHVGDFITEEDLWQHEVAVNGNNAYALTELARIRQEQGRVDDALRLYAQGVSGARALHDRTREHQLVMRLASTVMLATPDHDQPTLRRVRDFLDAVDRGDPAPVRFDAGGVRVALGWNDAERAARQRLYPYRVARAIAYARTLSYNEAERQLVAVVRASPDAWVAWENLSLVLAARGRWRDAVAAAQSSVARDPANPGPRALRDAIAAEGARVSAHPPASTERELAQCEAMLALRMFEGARARLDALLAAQPMNVAAVRLRARVEVDAGRAPEAEAVLAAARQRGVPGL